MNCSVLVRSLWKMDKRVRQEWLAEQLGTNQKNVSRWCSDRSPVQNWPNSLEIGALVRAFENIRESYFNGDEKQAVESLFTQIRMRGVATERMEREYRRMKRMGRGDAGRLVIERLAQAASDSYYRREVKIGPEAAGMLRNVKMTEKEYSDIVDCLLCKGMSGRMGRHTLMALAEDGNPMAAFEIGELYYYGYITDYGPNDQRGKLEARKWYLRAADRGIPAANWTLAYMIVRQQVPNEGPNGLPDYEEALRRLKAAGSSCAPALTTIGQLWQEGHIPADDFAVTGRFRQADEKKALALYEQAANMGYHYAVNRLAKHYHDRKEYKAALRHWEWSAELVRDSYALNMLGQYYEKGLGCEPDMERACRYYMSSVDDTLPGDRTAWARVNAGRVLTGRLDTYHTGRRDLERAADLLMSAMPDLKLPDQFLPLYAIMSAVAAKDVTEREARSIKGRFEQELRDYLLNTERAIAAERDEAVRAGIIREQQVIARTWAGLVERYQFDAVTPLAAPRTGL